MYPTKNKTPSSRRYSGRQRLSNGFPVRTERSNGRSATLSGSSGGVWSVACVVVCVVCGGGCVCVVCVCGVFRVAAAPGYSPIVENLWFGANLIPNRHQDLDQLGRHPYQLNISNISDDENGHISDGTDMACSDG